MSVCQDNYGFTPLKSTEDVIQLTTSLSGMEEDVETFYLLIAAKTDIPYTELMGKGAQGMDATGEGDWRKWYDKCRSIQQSVKPQLLKMYGIVAGRESGKFVEFTDYSFNPLEESTDKERAENLQSYATVAAQLIELGAKQEQVFDWLKTFKDLHLDNLEFDADTEGLEGYEDVTGDLKAEFAKQGEAPTKAENAKPYELKDDLNLPKDEYRHLYENLNNHLSADDCKGEIINIVLPFKNGWYMYSVVCESFNEYRLKSKRKTK